MIRWALPRAIDGFERHWNYDASYMHDVIDAGPRATWLFSRVATLGRFRRSLPIESWCAAGSSAVRHESCVVGGTLVMFDQDRVPAPADVEVRTA